MQTSEYCKKLQVRHKSRKKFHFAKGLLNGIQTALIILYYLSFFIGNVSVKTISRIYELQAKLVNKIVVEQQCYLITLPRVQLGVISKF